MNNIDFSTRETYGCLYSKFENDEFRRVIDIYTYDVIRDFANINYNGIFWKIEEVLEDE